MCDHLLMDADPLFLTLYSYFYTSICWEASGHVVSMIKRKHFSIRIASVVRFHATRTIVYISSLCLHLCPLCYLIALRISPPLCWARFFFWWVGGGGGGWAVTLLWRHGNIQALQTKRYLTETCKYSLIINTAQMLTSWNGYSWKPSLATQC